MRQRIVSMERPDAARLNQDNADIPVIVPDVWVPLPVQNPILPQLLAPIPVSNFYGPTVSDPVPVDAVVLQPVKVPVRQPDYVPRSIAFNPLAAYPGVNDPFFISTQSVFAAANARVVPPVVGKSSSVITTDQAPVAWVPNPIKPNDRKAGLPPRVAQSQTFNPLAASPGVDDPFFVHTPQNVRGVPNPVGKSRVTNPFIAAAVADAYVPPQTRPPYSAPARLPQSIAVDAFTTPAAPVVWVPPTIRAFRHETTPKPQTVSYAPTVSPFVEPEWLVTVETYEPGIQGPKPNKQAKSRAVGAFSPNVAPNVIFSPYIQASPVLDTVVPRWYLCRTPIRTSGSRGPERAR